MYQLNRLLTIFFVFGGIFQLNDIVYGQQPLQLTNGTTQPQTTSSRTRERHQSHYDYSQRPKGPQKYSWAQKYSTGVVINNDSTRRNLTNQKQSWDRQGDDPNRNPIHLIQQKILQSDVSTFPLFLYFYFLFLFILLCRTHLMVKFIALT